MVCKSKKRRLIALTAMIMIGVMIMVGGVSAALFDNSVGIIPITKDRALTIGDKELPYTDIWEKYNPIKISNLFGLGTTLFEGAITEHTQTCGSECSSTMVISIKEDSPLVDSINFYSVDNMGNIGSEISMENYKVYTQDGTKEIDMNDYTQECSVLPADLHGNVYNSCIDKLIGTHKEVVPNWIEYKIGESVKAGDYTIKIDGTKGIYESVDWIITSQGQKINDWAIWNTNQPIAYYKLDETTGNIARDSVAGLYNATNTAAAVWNTTGRIGGSSQSNDVDNNDFNTTINAQTNQHDFSINMWFKDEVPTGSDSGIMGNRNGGVGNFFQIVKNSAANKWVVTVNGTAIVTASQSDNTVAWQMISLTFKNSTGLWELYVNGTNEANGTRLVNTTWVKQIFIGGNGPDHYIEAGWIDEVGIWNSTLSGADITELWNGGVGLAYSGATIFSDNGQTFSNTTYSGAVEPFSLNFTYDNSSYTGVTARLSYNGTQTLGTLTGSGANRIANVNITIPTVTSTILKEFYWNVTLTNATAAVPYNSTKYNQTITPVSFGLCNSTLNVTYLNITFQDEVTLSSINATISSGSFNYYTDNNSSNAKNYTFSNATENPSYAFCFYPSSKNITLSSNFSYASTGYPTRTYSQSLNLSNSSTNTALSLLSASDGIYTTFVTISSASTIIQGVDIIIIKDDGITNTTIASGITDSAGSFTVFVNPNYYHHVLASKVGYGNADVTIKPTQSSYTIQLGTISNYSYVSNLKGLLWAFFPGVGIVENATNSFGFNISSTDGNIVKCRIELLNNNKTLVLSSANSSSANGSSCSVSTSFTLNDTYQRVKGRLLVDIGDGYQTLEDDAYWNLLPINTTGMTLTDWFNGFNSSNLDIRYFNNNDQHREYTYILMFFLLVTIICAVLNTMGWDIQTAGGMIFFIGLLVWGASVPGFLNLAGISPYSLIDKYFVAIIYSMFMIGFAVRRFD